MEKRSRSDNPLSFYRYMKGDSSASETDEEQQTPDVKEDNPFSFRAFTASPSPTSRRRAKEAPAETPTAAVVEAPPPVVEVPKPAVELPKPAVEVPKLTVEVPQTAGRCTDCRRLKKENQRLQERLQETLEAMAVLNQRVNKLTSQLEARDQRETAEASQLERMLRQVERNVQQSTQRAEDAERSVSHLQHRAGEVGTELVDASASAKQLLKQLLRGVDRLSVIGHSLQAEAGGGFREEKPPK